MIEKLHFIAEHPVLTTTIGLATTGAGVAGKIFEYMPIFHDVMSYGCMAMGAVASALGIAMQMRKWKSQNITDQIERLKLKQLQRDFDEESS